MITYLKSETERLEKELDYCGDCIFCDKIEVELSTLIKTSWIFARDFNNVLNTLYDDNKIGYMEDYAKIISYCEAKAKEHKIELEDGE